MTRDSNLRDSGLGLPVDTVDSDSDSRFEDLNTSLVLAYIIWSDTCGADDANVRWHYIKPESFILNFILQNSAASLTRFYNGRISTPRYFGHGGHCYRRDWLSGWQLEDENDRAASRHAQVDHVCQGGLEWGAGTGRDRDQRHTLH